jgi:hypothetical protein
LAYVMAEVVGRDPDSADGKPVGARTRR